MLQVSGGACRQVVEAEDLVPFGDQPVAQVGPYEARGSRHDESQMFSNAPYGITEKYRIHCATLAVYGSTHVAGSRDIRRAVVRIRIRVLAAIWQSLANRASF